MTTRTVSLLAVSFVLGLPWSVARASAGPLPPAPAVPITVTIGTHGSAPRGILEKLFRDDDVERSEREIERELRRCRWLDVVASGAEVSVEVTRRSVSLDSHSKAKNGKVSVTWRHAVRARIESGADRDDLEASSTTSESVREDAVPHARREDSRDRGAFERLDREVAEGASLWVLDRLDDLRPDRPDAGFRHEVKHKWLLKGDGLEVVVVRAGSPAARAGLEIGDRIRAVGREKGTSDMDLLIRTWWLEPAGTRFLLEVERGGRRRPIELSILPPGDWERDGS